MVIVGVCRARMAKNKDFLFLVYLVEYPVTPWRYGNGPRRVTLPRRRFAKFSKFL